MIKTILCRENNKTVCLGPANVKGAMLKKKVFWIDIQDPSRKDLDFLKNNLMLHELALEDCLTFTQHPKVEDYPEHLFIVMHDLAYAKEKLLFNEIDFFLGNNFLVTVHKRPINAVKRFQQKISEEPSLFQKGADFLLYELMDALIGDYFPVLDEMDDTIDKIEDKVFNNPTTKTLNKTFKLKRAVLELRKTVSPQREIVNAIIRGEFIYFKKNNLLYYRDIYDHLIRMYDMIDTYRDLITGILDAYLSMVSNKMNEIMKVLTIIATIMMPLTLITGFYGMNFQFMPEIHSPWGQQYGYFFVLGAMAVVGLIMLFFFKRKQWI